MRSQVSRVGRPFQKKNGTALRLQRVGLPRIGNGGHLPGDRFTLSVVVFVAVFEQRPVVFGSCFFPFQGGEWSLQPDFCVFIVLFNWLFGFGRLVNDTNISYDWQGIDPGFQGLGPWMFSELEAPCWVPITQPGFSLWWFSRMALLRSQIQWDGSGKWFMIWIKKRRGVYYSHDLRCFMFVLPDVCCWKPKCDVMIRTYINRGLSLGRMSWEVLDGSWDDWLLLFSDCGEADYSDQIPPLHPPEMSPFVAVQ